ncbi:Ig-like domain-containing protein, partial [Paenibacillus rigui]
LTLSAVSSDLSVATVKVTGTKLEVTPLAVGTSHITVKAEDGKGGKADASFVMNVTAPPAVNHKPELQTVPDQTLQIGSSAKELDLSTYLQDLDGDPLTVSAAAQNPSIATVTVTGNKLTLSPVGVGQTVINVSADDLRGGTATGMIQVTVESASATNHNPEVVSSISTQVLTSTVTNDRTYDLSQLFSDADGDTLQYTVTSDLPDAVNATVSGDTLTLSPGIQAGSAKVTVTANDSHGGTESYAFTVRNAPLVANGFVAYRTKQGVADFSYDLSAFFPNQSSFEVYKGTPDSTLSGPTTKNGKIISLVNDGTYTWVIGSDGKAVVIQVIVDPQGTPEMFFSEYLDGGDGRIAVELYYKGDGDPNHKAVGYQIEVYQWMTKTNTMKVTSKTLFDSWPEVPYIFIDSIFYDVFDITNISYYNDELDLYNPTEYNTVALVLKKDGQIIDVLGDPSSHDSFMPTGGTIVRKQGIYTGSKAFTGQGEWVTYPKGTFQYLGSHSL